MRSIFDLSTEEAWRLVAEELGENVPPLEAVENEDWGRDYILQRLLRQPRERLQQLGICIPFDVSEEQSSEPTEVREN